MTLLNPQMIGIGILVLLLSAGGSYVWGRHDGGAIERARQTEQTELIRGIEEAAQRAAATEIAKIEVKNVTIRQKAETITREVPVYIDCKHSPDGLQLVNEALTGRAEPAGNSSVPGTNSADR